MTILSSREVPIGIQGLAVLLVGIGGFYLAIFISHMAIVLGAHAARYDVIVSDLPNYVTMDVMNYLIPAVFALSASYMLFSQKKFARMLVIVYGCTALPALQFVFPGHPNFLFGIMGAVAIYYMWKPRVRAYFDFL